MSELTCIVCPRGCSLKIKENGNAFDVTGNSCKRGKEFAVKEMTCPMRTICSTVYTVFPEAPVLPVRVSADIPKSEIKEVMKAINSVILETRVGRGEAVIVNVCNLGVDVVATSNILKESE